MSVEDDKEGGNHVKAKVKWNSDRVTLLVFFIILGLIGIAMLYPIVLVVNCSFSNPRNVMQGDVLLLPVEPTLRSYFNVLKDERIPQGFLNSIFYTLLGTTINLVLTVCAAYPLSRHDLVGRKTLMSLMLFTMFFSGGMIPLYLVVKDLNLLNTVWALVLPTAISTYNVIVTKSFFENSIPREMHEAAQIDGCGTIRYLLMIVIPLSIPILTIITMFYAVDHWNGFYAGLMYLSKRQMFPLQLVLREILLAANSTMTEAAGLTDQLYDVEGIKYATIVVSSLPMVLAYPFMQKYFQKGVMLGAIKG